MRRHAASLLLGGALAALLTIGTAGVASAVPTTAETASGPWSAIAFSMETGSAAVAWNYSSESAAASAARGKCGTRGCQSAVEVANGCASLMQAPSGRWGWAYGRSRSDADGIAASHAGRGARLIAWTCSGDHV
ncbi:DUF4189 domain-containing protein [Actinomycetospora termitidis]|uniref:DUF4189 domain-containing protein n=1 Tax=Actinomycetospora termitidis TaxID=3053470 RepID=A0ABT7MG32_9PSEU|nr:DUF4189 domain-containing protein [Actinomycetospora sp. Odt1-22]MDL5158922.1 DUF4189 domain-containing protein [Actinomycetospora sp. Odt1-22]